ncbi:hypothetical protein K402DRAFT_151380 [Aulographum hederae CBS 113979]|uniref:Uncharacterized protein n=1 Tax=Aulographum hederae CBS 113979 TaxID=1176131 RepID=A0A6G1GT71_9PEZI|nr:hypothetical protein K402DRAFT_151380 [Aulographum hederae CBS 113979]
MKKPAGLRFVCTSLVEMISAARINVGTESKWTTRHHLLNACTIPSRSRHVNGPRFCTLRKRFESCDDSLFLPAAPATLHARKLERRCC